MLQDRAPVMRMVTKTLTAPQDMVAGERSALPPSLTDYAADRIRAAIIEGTFALGAKLSEKDLSSLLGISKTPVREALLRLKNDGLIEIRPRIGTYVFSLERHDIERIGEYRRILESSAVELAMTRNGERLKQSLRRSVERMRADLERSRVIDYVREDAVFHQAIFEHCGNDYVAEGYRSIASKVQAIRHRLSHDRDTLARSFADHVRILETIDAEDVGAAKIETLKHASIHAGMSASTYDTYLRPKSTA
jgi:DNA-binding GntR family transcriptional regulator